MSLAALSLTAALPAAAGLAQSAIQAGGQLGSGFLNVLSGLGKPDDKEQQPAPAIEGGESPDQSKLSLLSRAQSWSEKMMQWLNRHPSTQAAASGDLDVELSLDSLDQPHVSVQGEGAAEVEAALASDPTWMQEFRELALDRSAEISGSPQALKISQRDGEVQAAWQ